MRFVIPLMLLFSFSLTVRAEGPALWTFSDEDTTVHLFGSIHIMKGDVDWFVDEVAAAFAEADTLTVEVDSTKIDPTTMARLIQQEALFPPGDGLSRHLSAETIATLSQVIGAPPGQLERMRPWFVALNALQVVAGREGFLPQFGIDAVMIAKAIEAGIPVRQLETAEFQLKLISGFDEDEQAKALNQQLDQLLDLAGFFDQLLTAWLTEDLVTLEDEILAEVRRETPDLYEVIFDRRNKDWLAPLKALLDEPGTHMVVVGSGHLIGEGSVVDLLKKDGLTVTLD